MVAAQTLEVFLEEDQMLEAAAIQIQEEDLSVGAIVTQILQEGQLVVVIAIQILEEDRNHHLGRIIIFNKLFYIINK